jgi:hypothetical protein
MFPFPFTFPLTWWIDPLGPKAGEGEEKDMLYGELRGMGDMFPLALGVAWKGK